MNRKMLGKTYRKHKYLLIFSACSPGLWWFLFKIGEVFTEWTKTPFYVRSKITSIYTPEILTNTGLMRWASLESGFPAVLSKLAYNRLTIIFDEFFNFLSFFSPRIYFQSGDGSTFSPSDVEPIPALLFPLSFFGVAMLIKKGKIRPFLLFISFGFLAYLTGQRNFSFLWPLLIIFIFFSSKGLEFVDKKFQPLLVAFIFLYSFFVLGRVVWSTL